MARPRPNRNGLWAKIFGKIVGEIAKVEKFSEKFSKKLQKFSKKIAENSKKIVEKFQKNCRKTYENFLKLSLLPINLRNPKKFSSRIA